MPRYLVYFYSKALNIPENLTDKYEIERRLDVTTWFTIELQEMTILAHNYNILMRVSGAQRQ
jgi:hypothetical protein